MKVPYSWLKDFVEIDVSPEELGKKLVSAGFEIEEYIYPSEQYKNIVVGEILKVMRHPNADKLLVCSVNVGAKNVQIVTGANNIKQGDFVPVCLDKGSIRGKIILSGELRGVASEGMFCGGEELDLTSADYESAGVDGIMILGKEYPPGTDFNEVIGTNDCILDIAVTANRPDCNSVLGIAREVAAVLDRPLKKLDFGAAPKEQGDVNDYIKVTVEDFELCPRYMAKAITDVKIAVSPEIIRKRLRLVGLRPINNIVDITNYILIELGQPMHAFDKRYLAGGEIIVRRAKDSERIVTLDGKENILDSSNLVICDSVKPVALAGIMGGSNSGIASDTKTIILESARFKRDNIRRSSKTLGIRSDSSSRFEKGVDFVSQELAISRAVQLITMGCGTAIKGVIDAFVGESKVRTLTVSAAKINAILGITVGIEKMTELLNRLQLKTTAEGDRLTIEVPRYREDIATANDVAEEVIRLYGYDNIVNLNLDGFCQTRGGLERKAKRIHDIKALLSGESAFMEIVAYSFVSPRFVNMLSLPETDIRTKTINLINPLGEELSAMRTMLIHSMLTTVAFNTTHGNKRGKLFEIGRVYFPKRLPLDDTADEYETLSLATFGADSGFYRLKSTLEILAKSLNISLVYKPTSEPFLHPGRSADIFIAKTRIGYIGEVHPLTAERYGIDSQVTVAELNLELLFEYAKEFLPFRAISKFPAIERDFAFVLDKSIAAANLLEVIQDAGGELLEELNIFDVYEGKGVADGKKSVAVNLTFRDSTRTLVDADVVHATEKILEATKNKLGALLRA